jgi:hypothetical protein|tara:strand:- start:216 stop:341 length:126 start_codon:yes stop_codon:yes gene_type:complete
MRMKIKEVKSGGIVKRKANSNKELLAYLKVLKLFKRLGQKL